MDHLEAARLSLVEKYLLDELPPELRDEFEGHYFDCNECATDLRATAAFLDAAKNELKTLPVVRPAPETAKKPRFPLRWMPTFVLPALAACLLVIAYQNIVVYPRYRSEIAQLNAPEIPPSVSLVGNSRGGETSTLTVRRMQAFLLYVDIPAQDRFSSYTCLLYSPAGSLAWRIEVSAQLAKDTVPISVPAANLTEGTYTLIVQGNTDRNAAESGVDLEHQRFTLKIQE